MKFQKETTWEMVFNGWREHEAKNPGWIRTATEVKGWPDWESWRRFTADQIGAADRSWSLFLFENPLEEIPSMLLGPYSNWQAKVTTKNQTSFRELLNDPIQYQELQAHQGIQSILGALPFSTALIGLIRDDTNALVCIEGHHRATAIAIAAHNHLPLVFDTTPVSIAVAHIPKNECALFESVLKRGTSKNPKA